MVEAFCILLLFQLLGEGMRILLHLPVPGPVIGLFLLAAVRVGHREMARRSGASVGATAVPSDLDTVARTLIRHMGLLFVPAGVGIVATAGLVAPAWLPITAGLVGSTVLGLLVTGWVMHGLLALRRREGRP